MDYDRMKITMSSPKHILLKSYYLKKKKKKTCKNAKALKERSIEQHSIEGVVLLREVWEGFSDKVIFKQKYEE